MEPKSSKALKVANWKACKILCNQDDKCSYFIFKVNIRKQFVKLKDNSKVICICHIKARQSIELKLAYVLLLKADTYFEQGK